MGREREEPREEKPKKMNTEESERAYMEGKRVEGKYKQREEWQLCNQKMFQKDRMNIQENDLMADEIPVPVEGPEILYCEAEKAFVKIKDANELSTEMLIACEDFLNVS